ncbi:MAG: Cna B-type domain-containing protein [Oscillospiraceae bacterium]|nr:Cna B-type domain-containing protein [Oscillospiraceae bacterium]
MKKLISIVLTVVMLFGSLSSAAIEVLAAPTVENPVFAENGTVFPRTTDGGDEDPVDRGSSGGGGGDGSTLQIEGIFSTLVLGAEEQDNGDYVWTPETTNPDHLFKFTVTYSISGEFDYFEKNQISIHIPYTILKDQAGDPADYFDISLPHADDPNLTDDNVFVYRIDTLDDNSKEIVVYNRLPCPAAQHGYFDVGYSTSKRTYDYKDYDPNGATPADRHPSADFKAKLVIYRDGEEHSEESKPNHVYIDTTAKITRMEKYAPQTQYTAWQSSWGTKPADDNGQYYYLLWQVRSCITATQRYNFTLTDTFNVTDGEVVAIKMQGENVYRPTSDTNCGKVYNQTTSYPNGRYDNVITRHLKATYDEQPTYSFTNKAYGNVHPLDGVDRDSNADATKRWAYEHPVFHPGSGVGMSFDKYGYDYNDKRVYDSEDIRSFDLDPYHTGSVNEITNLAWYTSSAATTYALTVPEGLTNTDPNNYFLVPATVELTDNRIGVRLIGESSSVKLNAGEYRFDKVVVSYTMLDAYFDETTQSFKTKAVTYEPNEAITIYAQFGTDEWVAVGSLATATAAFTPTEAGTSHNVTASGKTIIFGDHTCTGYRLVASNKHYRTTLGAKPYVTLLRCEKVDTVVERAYTENQNEFAVVNTASTAVYKGADNTGTPVKTASKSGVDYVIGISRQSAITKSVRFKNDPLNQRCVLTWSISMNESYLSEGGKRVYVEQQSGMFYDLLPYGGTFDKSSLVVYSDSKRLNQNQYSVETQSNYLGSGRTLLIISIYEPAKTSYSFNYATNHSWDSIAEFGNYVLNSVAYETGNEDIGDGYPDNGGPASGSGHITDRLLMTDLDPDTNANKFIYTQCSHNIVALTAGNLGLYKKVMAEKDEDYVYATTTISGGEYSYKIHFATDAATWVKDMILFDSLENYVLVDDTVSDWHGILQGFDFTVLEANGIDPVLYYSTKENLQIKDLGVTADYNFAANAETWIKASGPNDPNLVNAHAFAIDIRKTKTGDNFVLDPSSALTAIVYMKAPDAIESEAINPTAYNNIFLFNSVKFGHDSEFADPSLNHQDYTRISFRQMAEIKILKIDYDVYETTGEIVPIPGIVFRLWGDSHYGDYIDYTYTTNSLGIINFGSIPRGVYTLQELDGVDDYVEDHTPITVTIDQNGNVIFGELVDDAYTLEPYGTLVIGYDEGTATWVLSNRERVHGDLDFDKVGKVVGQSYTTPLLNVSFLIYGTSYYSTEINMPVSSGGDGVVHIRNLERGTYEMVETSTNANYFPLDTVFTVICDANGDITISYVDEDGNTIYPLENGDYVIVNTPYYELPLWKYNSVTGDSISGAKFKLTGENYYDEQTSGSDGLLTFRFLVPGTYVLRELEAPEGVIPDNKNHTVIVDNDGNITIDGKTIQEYIDEYLTSTTVSGDINYFPIPNEPEKGTITIIKEWVGLAEGETPNVTPTLHLDTTKPNPNIPEATIDYDAWTTYVNGMTIPDNGSATGKHGLIQENFRIQRTIDDSPQKVRIDIRSFEKYNNRDIPTAEQMNQSVEESWADIAAAVTSTSQYVFDEETILKLEQWRRIDDDTTNYRIFIKLVHVDDTTTGSGSGLTYISVYKAVWWSDAPNVYLPENASKMFAALTYMIGTLDLRGIKSSRTTDMSQMFEQSHCSEIRMDFDTSKVTTMHRMFRYSSVQQLPDIVTWDTSSVTDMSRMFECSGLRSIDMTHWNTSSVTTLASMFHTCKLECDLDFSMLDFSNVTSMAYMFYNGGTNCQVTSIKFPKNLAKVTTMYDMFTGSKNLVTIDFNGADARNVTDVFQLIIGCDALKTLILPDDMRSITNQFMGAFRGMKALETIVMPTRLDNCSSLQDTFNGDKALTSIDMSYCYMPNMVNFMTTFNGCSGLTTILMPEGANMLSKVKSFWMMCYGCTSLTSFDLSGRNLSGVIDEWGDSTAGFEWMFANCSSLQTVDFSGSYAPNTMVTYEMFRNCSNLTTCNMEGFILGGPDTIYGGGSFYMMFFGCEKLEEIDISGFYTPDANHQANAYYMFGDCKKLATIYASAEWPTEGFTPGMTGGSLSCYFMFHGCTLLHNDGFDSAHPENNKNYCTFTTNTTLPGNFTQKDAPTVPTFPADPVPSDLINASPSPDFVIEPATSGENGTTKSETPTEQSISYTSEPNKWVQREDGTWSYTFDVYDVDGTYYLWESALPGYESDCTIENPITIHYTAGGTITTEPADKLVEYETGKYGVKITNTKVVPDYVSITLNKIVTGVEDDETEFVLHIVVTDLEENPVPDALYGDVTLIGGEADVTLKNNGVVTLLNLPAGIIYEVTEPDTQDFEATITNGSGTLEENGASVTVTVENHKDVPVTVGLEVTKVLTTDGEAILTDEDLARKFSVTVTLYTDSTFETVATEINGLYGDVHFTDGVGSTMIGKDETVSITGLPTVDDNGDPLPLWYKVEEAYVEGFNVSYTGQAGQPAETPVSAVITNTKFNPPVGGFKVVKVLEGASAGDTTTFNFAVSFNGLKPGVTYIYTIGTTEYSFTALAGGNWYEEFSLTNGQTATFTNLPENATYTVTETGNDYIPSFTLVSNKTVGSASGNNTIPTLALSTGTETVEDGEDATITFTNTPAVVDVEGHKEWVGDEDVAEVVRPDHITIYLMEGTAQIQELTVYPDDNGYWSWSFTNLPKYDSTGSEITYSIEEEVVYGYETTIEGYNVTNTYIHTYIDIPVQKLWQDNNNHDNTRPGSIILNLYADGVLKETVSVSADLETGNWSYVFEHLPKYRTGSTTKEIEYTVTENAVPGYVSTLSGNSMDGFTITNTLVTNIEGEKTWLDGEGENRPESIVIHLLADGVDTEKFYVATPETNWSWSFSNLPVYKIVDDAYVEIEYTITEEAVSGYLTVINGYNVTNIEKTEATVVKVWNDDEDRDGARPDYLTVQLKADGAAYGDPTVLNEDNDWSATIENLPKYKDGGTEIIYTWEELDLPATYTLTGNTVNGTITTLTNTHEPGKISICVEKQWRDDDNRDGIRPQSIHVQLLANDDPYGEPIELNEENEWKYTWNDLPEKAAGVEIVYTIDEIDIPEGYGITINGTPKEGFLIINPHTPAETEATVIKVWDDDDDNDGARPDYLTVQLKADGEAYGDPTVLNEDNDWTATIENLPKYKDGGIEIVYTWEEVDLPNTYTLTGNVANDTVTTLTNTHEPEKIQLDGVKIWAGETDKENQRPASITIRLYADGVEIDHVVVTAATGWTFKFEGLDKYKDGVEIEYTITEDEVVGYKTSISGTKVTNTWKPPHENPPTSDRAIFPTKMIILAAVAGFVLVVARKRRFA